VKDVKILGFAESVEIVKRIDESASKLGLDRSNYLRMIIREKLGTDSK
jgi:hypothetical protein